MGLPIETIKVARASGETREYLLKQMPARIGLTTSTKVGALLAGPLGSLLGASMGLRPEPKKNDIEPIDGEPAPSFSEAKVSPEALSNALTALGISLGDPHLIEIVETMMGFVGRIDVDKAGVKTHRNFDWETEFQAEYGALLEVTIAALRFNFKSFFSTGPAKGLLSAGRKYGASILQQASTGASPS